MHKCNSYAIVALILSCMTLSPVISQKNWKEPINLMDQQDLGGKIIKHICQDSAGNLWIGHLRDLSYFNGHEIRKIMSPVSRTDAIIADIFLGPKGNIWVMYRESIFDSEITKNLEKKHHIYSKKSNYHSTYIIDKNTYTITLVADYLNTIVDTDVDIDVLNIWHRDNGIYIEANEKIYLLSEKLTEYLYLKEGELVEIMHNGLILYNDTKKKDGITFDNSIFESFTWNIKDTLKPIYFSEPSGYLFKTNKDSTQLLCINDATFKFDLNSDIFLKNYLNEPVHGFKKNTGFMLFDGDLYAEENNIYTKQLLKTNGEIRDFHYGLNGLFFATTDWAIYIYSPLEKTKVQTLASSRNTNSVRSIFVSEQVQFHNSGSQEIISSKEYKEGYPFIKNRAYLGNSLDYYQDPSDSNVIWSSIQKKNCGLRKIDFRLKDEICISKIKTRFSFRSKSTSTLYTLGINSIYSIDDATNKLTLVYAGEISKRGIAEFNHYLDLGTHILLAAQSGIYIMNERGNEVVVEKYWSNDKQSKIEYIHQDHQNQNILWLGTRGDGLIELNTVTMKERYWTDHDGLSNRFVHAIFEDSLSRLWLSTDENINCFDKKTSDFHIITKNDGISNSKFNKNSFHEDKTNNVYYFGGINGYNYFNPYDFNFKGSSHTNIRLLELRLTDRNGGHRVLENIKNRDKIEIHEKYGLIEFTLATDNLYEVSNTTYRIKNVSRNIELAKHNGQKFSFLKPDYGIHTIEIVGNQNTSRYSNPFRIDFIVIRPFYKTIWFYLLAALTLSALILLITQRRLYKAKQRSENLQQLVDKRTLSLTTANKFKDQLIGIIAHDFQTPIMSLQYFNDKLNSLIENKEFEQIKNLSDMTSTQLESLHLNLNNLLLWEMDETGHLEHNPKVIKLKAEIEQVINLQKVSISSKNINIRLSVDDYFNVYADSNHLQTILRNILSNAIKFSFEKSNIDIKLNCNSDYQGFVEIMIIDSGIGLKASKKIDYRGNGFGLSIIKKLSETNNISIEFNSNESQGTTVLIRVPTIPIISSEK